jgi:hypothetical protein
LFPAVQHHVPAHQVTHGIPILKNLGRQGRLAPLLVDLDQTIKSREIAGISRNQ